MALTGLEAERSVSKISCSQEMERSVSKISCSREMERSVSDLGIKGPLGSGAHRAGGGKNRLGACYVVALTGLEAGRSVSKISCSQEMERSVSKISCSQEMERSVSDLGIKGPLGSGAHRAGGGKIRLENFLLPGDGKIRLENFLLPGDGKIRLGPWDKRPSRQWRSPGWKREEPSRTLG